VKTKKTILLVDDDPDDIEIFNDALKQIDSTITLITAHNGRDALHILCSDILEKPDHVFLDINMPLMNGLDCLDKIRNQEKLSIPVTIYTTSKSYTEYNRSVQLGADFLQKPHDYTSLLVVLRKKIDMIAVK
jgi:DNA-binding NtrC family response regulator